MYIHDVPAAIKCLPPTRTVFLSGPPGVGKTTIVYNLAKELDVPLYEDSLVTALPEDIRGLPDFDREKDMTRWRPPSWFRRFAYDITCEEANDEVAGIIFLDELPSAAPTVQVCAQKICQERQIGNYKLHPGVRVIVAGNRKEDKALVSDMPAPLRTKIIWINVEPHLGARFPNEPKGWIQNFAIPAEIDERVISFLRFKDELFCDNDPDKYKQAAPNPRTWHAASDVLKGNPPEELFDEILVGTVGEGPAHEFVEFEKVYSRLPSMEQIKKEPTKAPLHENDPSFLFAVTGFLVSNLKGQGGKSVMDPCLTYMLRSPEEFKMMFLHDLVNQKGMAQKLQNSKVFLKEYSPLVNEMLTYGEDE